jgi:hypothetical protein
MEIGSYFLFPQEQIKDIIITAATAQQLQVHGSADEWSRVREAVRVTRHQREDDATSLASTPTTFSRVSFLPSDHSQQLVVERGISEHQIKQAKVRRHMSLAAGFDDDYLEQQARTKAREWGEQLKASLAGLSLGDTTEGPTRGPPHRDGASQERRQGSRREALARRQLVRFKPKSYVVYLEAQCTGRDCGRRGAHQLPD